MSEFVDTKHEWSVKVDGPRWSIDLDEAAVLLALDVELAEPTLNGSFALLLGEMFLLQAHTTALAAPLHVEFQTVVGPLERLSVQAVSLIEPIIPSEMRGSITLRRIAR